MYVKDILKGNEGKNKKIWFHMDQPNLIYHESDQPQLSK